MIDRNIEISYDAEADAAYLYVQARGPSREVASTRLCQIELESAAINVDFDGNGRIAGIELLGASRLLPQALID
jgi:uncharacterized protein YuzE